MSHMLAKIMHDASAARLIMWLSPGMKGSSILERHFLSEEYVITRMKRRITRLGCAERSSLLLLCLLESWSVSTREEMLTYGVHLRHFPVFPQKFLQPIHLLALT